jgi:hypothetical protein
VLIGELQSLTKTVGLILVKGISDGKKAAGTTMITLLTPAGSR